MSSNLLLALFIVGITLVVPLMVWGQSSDWRLALTAWKQYSAWLGGLLALGFVVWLLMAV